MLRRNRSRSYVLTASTLVVLAFALSAVVFLAINAWGASSMPEEVASPELEESFAVYFSNPGEPGGPTNRSGPEMQLVAALDLARLSVDLAAYDLNLWSVRDALLSAHRRGVQVRLVCDSDNIDREEIQALIEAGIPVLGDRRESLMHHKFTVIDRQEVWTGSMNYTLNGAYKNDNNLIRIRSSQLAEDYLTEFDEMFVADLFGSASLKNTPFPNLAIEGTLVEVYFSPEDGVATNIIRHIESAQETIYFMAYSFTADEIAAALIARVEEGVDVAGVMEWSQFRSNAGSEFENFTVNGLDVRLDGNPANMHHKVIIIDEKTVITGSYNFSVSAEKRNDENIVVIHNEEIATQFLNEFARVYAQAQRQVD
jgi:phosphatidylserine/phosphatidylglycerophosphate/cardiolipin synthase-like enzyme